MGLTAKDIQVIEYRNKIVTRLRSRVKNFGSGTNYYQIRLNQIDECYPELRGKGIINIKRKATT